MARYQAGIRTEARIVDATRQLLGEVGLEGTTLKAICDRAEVRAGSFYNLFGSKEEVVFRVIREAITAVDPDPEGSGKDTLEELVAAFASFVVDQATLARIYLQIATTVGVTDDSVGRRLLRDHERRLERFGAALQRRRPTMTDQEARAAAQILLAALHGLAWMWLLDPSFDFPHHARLLVES